VTDAYRQKRKHIDAHEIGAAFLGYTRFPSTFDGALPSEAGGRPGNRLLIGETYHFTDIGPEGMIGTVTTATVSQPEKVVYAGVTDQNGQGQILSRPMSDQELAEYEAHPDAYFGIVTPVSKEVTNIFEMFEWLMETQKSLSREQLLGYFANSPLRAELENLSDEELLMAHCESMTAAFQATPGA
jgi:hypothetical protein